MKKLVALLLVLVTLFAFAASASAKAVDGGIVYNSGKTHKVK